MDRKKFVKECIDNPEKANNKLIEIAARLGSSRKTSERVNAVSELLHLSPATIWRDYSSTLTDK
jgi:hypothetical protein